MFFDPLPHITCSDCAMLTILIVNRHTCKPAPDAHVDVYCTVTLTPQGAHLSYQSKNIWVSSRLFLRIQKGLYQKTLMGLQLVVELTTFQHMNHQ